MTPEQFAYWLQGYVELNRMVPSYEQWKSIRAHLATVFVKVTPVVNEFVPSNVKPVPERNAKSMLDLIHEAERLGQGVATPPDPMPSKIYPGIVC
jgi:hypothetical protein